MLSGSRISGLFSFHCCTHQLMSVSCMPVTSWEGFSHRLNWAWQSAGVSVGPLPLCCVVFLGWQYNEGLQLSKISLLRKHFLKAACLANSISAHKQLHIYAVMYYGGTIVHSVLNSTKCNELLLFQDYQLALRITESQLIRINFYLLLSGFFIL